MATAYEAGASSDAVRLYRALAHLTRAMRRDARGAPIGPGALSALATLVTTGPQRAGSLAEDEGVSPPAMTRLLRYLEDQEYVVRQPDPHDRRACLIVATESGEQLVRSGRAERLRGLEERLAALPEEEHERLLAALPALEALADG